MVNNNTLGVCEGKHDKFKSGTAVDLNDALHRPTNRDLLTCPHPFLSYQTQKTVLSLFTI